GAALAADGLAVGVAGAVVLVDLAVGVLLLAGFAVAAGAATFFAAGLAALAGVTGRVLLLLAGALVALGAGVFFAGAGLVAVAFLAGAFFAGAAAFLATTGLAGFFAAGLTALVALTAFTGLAALPAAAFLAPGLAVFPVALAAGEGFLAGVAACFTGFLAATYEGSSDVFPGSAGKRAFIAHPTTGGNLTGRQLSCRGDYTPAYRAVALL